MKFPKKKVILGYTTILLTMIVLGFEERDVTVNAFHIIVLIVWLITVVGEAIVLLFLKKWGLGLSVLVLFPVFLFLPYLISSYPEITYQAQQLIWFIPLCASFFLITYEDGN